MDFNQIKCIIWDLDNTFWKGILAENHKVSVDKTINLLQYSSEVGIVHSICSKNEYDVAIEKLEELGCKDYFVFNSINYASKGQRIQQQIEAMHFRPQNVLFIDDEIPNLKEAEFFCPGLMISQPYIVAELTNFYEQKYREGYRKNRINEYRILEQKECEAKRYETNEEFLHNLDISVSIEHDVLSELDRVYELVQRTNQLNFTKRRSTLEELLQEIADCDETGYVTVDDKFGDYGIIGFFLIKSGSLLHFVFSCRVISMGVEQYVYKQIGEPFISINEPVASDLFNIDVQWINKLPQKRDYKKSDVPLRILLKGSCDFERMRLYLPSNIKYEVQYMINGKQVVYQTGIPTMAMTVQFDIETIRKLARSTPFYDERYYKTSLFSQDYDVVVLSTISLANLGVYRHKEENFYLSMGLPEYPMYMKEYEEKYSREGIYGNGYDNDKESFEYLRNNFDYIDDEYIDKYLEEHIRLIIRNIKAASVILILGNEERYLEEKTPAGKKFEKINHLLTALKKEGLFDIINLSDIINDEMDVVNHFNHFSSRVYFELAKEITKIITEKTI